MDLPEQYKVHFLTKKFKRKPTTLPIQAHGSITLLSNGNCSCGPWEYTRELSQPSANPLLFERAPGWDIPRLYS